MDSTVCFYTFSTIAQTLAGAFGFSIAVALYRLQILRTELLTGLQALVHSGKFVLHQDLAQHASDENWTELAKIVEALKFKEGLGMIDTLVQVGQRETFIANIRKYEEVRKYLRKAMNATGLTIIASLILLPLTPFITCHPAIASFCLVASVVAAIYSIWTYHRLIRNLAR